MQIKDRLNFYLRAIFGGKLIKNSSSAKLYSCIGPWPGAQYVLSIAVYGMRRSSDDAGLD